MGTMKDVLKIAVAALLATLLTGAAAWVTFGADKVTRVEMKDYVDTRTPWIRDRGEIQSAIRGNTRNIDRLQQVCDKMVNAQQQLLVEQRVLINRVDALVDDK